MKRIPAALFFLIVCCKSTTGITDAVIEKFPYAEYAINYGWYGWSDSLEFTRVGENLYKGSDQQLYFLSYYKPHDNPKNEQPIFILRFFDNFYYEDARDSVDNIGKVIDVATFKKSQDGFYRDKHNKYEFVPGDDGGSLHIVQNDPETYKELEKGFYLGADGKMYIKTAGILDPEKGEGDGPSFFREVPTIDTATFQNLGEEGWYAKDSKNVYIDHFMTDGRHIWLLKEADVSTFQVIGYRWGKDRNHVFENGILLEGMNPDSMQVLCPDTTAYNQVFFSMVKDNDQVFYDYDEMKGVDAPTFECVVNPDSTISYRDKNWIYNKDYFPNAEEKNRTKRK
ncbi:MAG TPA: DKNYY domain-containing protein [Bacteroidia bacterium]|nr:DKNYY domain-containing protein [Bacteroidia bacterium]